MHRAITCRRNGKFIVRASQAGPRLARLALAVGCFNDSWPSCASWLHFPTGRGVSRVVPLRGVVIVSVCGRLRPSCDVRAVRVGRLIIPPLNIATCFCCETMCLEGACFFSAGVSQPTVVRTNNQKSRRPVAAKCHMHCRLRASHRAALWSARSLYCIASASRVGVSGHDPLHPHSVAPPVAKL